MQRSKINRTVVLLLALAVSALFLTMIRQFLMAIFLAGIFATLSRPLYRRFLEWSRGHRGLASATTLILLVFLVVIPAGLLLAMVAAQAVDVAQAVPSWIDQRIAEANDPNDPNAFPLRAVVERLPFSETILAHEESLRTYSNQIWEKAGQAVGAMARFFVGKLSDVTLGTLNFFLTIFMLLYTMYFFLMDGDKLLNKILLYLPLEDSDEQRLLDRFASVARATIKGTVVIGIIQGILGGLAFAVLGIRGALFWGTVMAVTSVIPGIGTALVWLPAVVILLIGGHVAKAIGLALFCAIVVGGIDNILRPLLVGKDTKMHELMILFSSLGGIVMFGFVGFIIGPIVAALFVTVWDIYGMVFRDLLPPVGKAPPIPPPAPKPARKKSRRARL